MSNHQIIIAGSGVIGLTAAASLAQRGYRVAVTGAPVPSFDAADYGPRVYAINAASCRLFQHIGVWEQMCRLRVFPYAEMHVWDDEGGSELDFKANDVGVSELGFIIEDKVLRSVLYEFLQEQPEVTIHCPACLEDVEERVGTRQVTLSDRQTLTADLIVGADGAQSWVRRHIGAFWRYTDYRQTAIVATIQLTEPHQNTCWQKFYRDGVLALLPLAEGCGSIVWSCKNAIAEALMNTNESLFEQRLSETFDDRFGVLKLCSKRVAFPLFGGEANRYTQDGFVLVGDAAHHVHPLAGQGANFGLADVQKLSEALSAGSLPSLSKLRRYERSVKEHNVVGKAFLEGLNYLFTERHDWLHTMTRTYGVSAVNHCAPLKNWFIRRAIG